MSAQLTTALREWRAVQQARWLKKGEDMPAWVFPSRTGTALEERNVRHVFERMLSKAAYVISAFTTSGIPLRRCSSSRVKAWFT